MITGLSDDTALFLVPAQSSVSNHRPKTNIQCFQESVGVLTTERSVQLTGSHHHRRVLQRLARPSVQNCCSGEEPKPTHSTRGAAGPVPASDFVRGNNLHVSALTFQIQHHRLGSRAGLFFKIHQKVPSMHQAFEITLSHSVLEVKKKKKMRMISEAAVKFTFSSVSFKEHCQLGKNT